MSLRESESAALADNVLPAFPWIVAVRDAGLIRQKYLDVHSFQQALNQLTAGKTSEEVFGWTAQRLTIPQIRSVAWVAGASTALIRIGWWRDPWRLTFENPAKGEAFFQGLAKQLPFAGPPTEACVGPNDLEVDPKFVFMTIIVLCGFFAMIAGATEGLGQAPQGMFEWLFRLVGRAAGLVVVFVFGAAAIASGLLGLAWWYRHRPTKVVVRANDRAR